MRISRLLCSISVYLTIFSATGDVFDLINKRYYSSTERWLEVGRVSITTDEWVTVRAAYSNFIDPVVFLGLPQSEGSVGAGNELMAFRVRGAQLTSIDTWTSHFEFQARIFTINASQCSVTYTPSTVSTMSSFVGWLVVEKGAFKVSGATHLIHSDTINRTNANAKDNKINQFKSELPRDLCSGGVCALAGSPDGYLSIAQLQTTRYDRYLLLRGVEVGATYTVYVLSMHDSVNFYNVPNPGEDFGWMLFEAGTRLACEGGVAFESSRHTISSEIAAISFASEFLSPPLLFGMVNSLIGRDAVNLVSLNCTATNALFAVQEDSCQDDETRHHNVEIVSILVFGRTIPRDVQCGVTIGGVPTSTPTIPPSTSPSNAPTANPSFLPTCIPSASPTAVPTINPTSIPTCIPSASPTAAPTATPSFPPTLTPSAVPTAPTHRPTSRPTTEIATLMTIEGSTMLMGTTCTDELVISVFEEALALKLSLESNDVTAMSCVDSLNRRLCDIEVGRRLQDNVINIMFEIGFVIEEKGFSDPGEAFQSLNATMLTLLEDGSMAELVNKNSGSNISIMGLHIASYKLQAKRTGAPTASPTSETIDQSDFFGGPFYYVVYGISGAILLSICCLACYFYASRTNRDFDEPPIKKSKSYDIQSRSSKILGAVNKTTISVSGVKLDTHDISVVVALIHEHWRLNAELRRQISDPTSHHVPSLVSFIMDSFGTGNLSKDHKKFLKTYLKKLSAENNALWNQSVRVGVNAESAKPFLLNIAIGVVAPLSTGSTQSMPIHYALSAQSKQLFTGPKVVLPPPPSQSSRYSLVTSDSESTSNSVSMLSSQVVEDRERSPDLDFTGEELSDADIVDDIDDDEGYAPRLARPLVAGASRRMQHPADLLCEVATREQHVPARGAFADLSTVHPPDIRKASLLSEIMKDGVLTATSPRVCGPAVRPGVSIRKSHDLGSFVRVADTGRNKQRKSGDAFSNSLSIATVQEDAYDPYALWDVPRTNLAKKAFYQSPSVYKRRISLPAMQLATLTEDGRSSYADTEDEAHDEL